MKKLHTTRKRRTYPKTLMRLFAFLGVSCGTVSAQEVTNPAYSAVLKTLLSHNVAELGVQDACALSETLFVDARQWEEYQVSHIEGARWVGYKEFELDRLEGTSKAQPIVVYCSVGYRSERIALRLQKAGYSNVYNLYGGIIEWVNQGQPVVNREGATLKVHVYNALWGVWLQQGEKVY